MATSDVSDGEIVELGDEEQDNSLEEISSEDDYFENLRRLTARKLELEQENTALRQFADNGKENRYSNRQRPSTTRKKKRLKPRYEASRDANRTRSYRASSVFSNYSIPKRRNRTRSHRKDKRTKAPSDDKSKAMAIIINSEDESSDDELLKLRLDALKSTLKSTADSEVKELEVVSPIPAKEPTEEDNLRILALKSAVLKKKEFFKERKKQKMLENMRPYSPSDDLTPLVVDDDAMAFSPLGSPFNEVETIQEVDMDISPPSSPLNTDTNDTLNDAAIAEEDNDEETLRSLLLSSMPKKLSKSDETPQDSESESIALNLKMAVRRLKQKKETLGLAETLLGATYKGAAIKGNKTIKMILEEQKSKQKTRKTAASETTIANDTTERKTAASEMTGTTEICGQSTRVDVESTLNDPMNEMSILLQPSVPSTGPATSPPTIEMPPENVQTPDSSFSTITDTKNIPLIPASNQVKRSRLITNITEVIKPVAKLVININADSETEDENARLRKYPLKKNARKIIRAPANVQPGFEKKLELFLSSIRQKQESSADTSNKTATESREPKKTNQVAPMSAPEPSVNLLPKSSQIEYEQLKQKMKILEAKQLRKLKRTKSTSIAVEPQPTQQQQKESTPSHPATAAVPTTKKNPEPIRTLDKVKQSLAQVPNLQPEGKERLVVNAEKVYRNHSEKLMNASQQSIKLLEENEADMKKQEAYTLKIGELEQILRKYKSSLITIEQRVKVNIHKIVQSQRETIKRRIHQKNFGEILQQIGTMVRGDTYSVAEHVSPHENFLKIVAGTELLMRSSNDPVVKNSMKVIAERVRSFVSVPAEINTKEPDNVTNNECAKEIHSKALEITENINTAEPRNDFDDDKESEIFKMLQENSTMQATEEEEPPVEIHFPEIQKWMGLDGTDASNKRAMRSASRNQGVVKKLKYESPLEFLRLSKNKTTSVNKILCPYQLSGSCDDEKCKMQHI